MCTAYTVTTCPSQLPAWSWKARLALNLFICFKISTKLSRTCDTVVLLMVWHSSMANWLHKDARVPDGSAGSANIVRTSQDLVIRKPSLGEISCFCTFSSFFTLLFWYWRLFNTCLLLLTVLAPLEALACLPPARTSNSLDKLLTKAFACSKQAGDFFGSHTPPQNCSNIYAPIWPVPTVRHRPWPNYDSKKQHYDTCDDIKAFISPLKFRWFWILDTWFSKPTPSFNKNLVNVLTILNSWNDAPLAIKKCHLSPNIHHKMSLRFHTSQICSKTYQSIRSEAEYSSHTTSTPNTQAFKKHYRY